MTALANRYDIVFYFEVTNGNPNGDPDAGNLPRMDPETNHGLVSDVSLKRKIRNYTELTKGTEPGWRIYVQEGSILNDRHREAYAAVRPSPDGAAAKGKDAKLNPKDDAEAKALTKFMCDNFFDVRTFGAVMSTGVNAGQVRGPVQVAFAKSVDPILPLEISITRMAATNASEKAERDKGNGDDERTDNRTMGRKHIVPYGLYRAHLFINASLAARTGFGEGDLTHLFEALGQMFEHDRSAARGEMATRRCIAFRHAGLLGKAPAHSLFDRVTTHRRFGDEFYPVSDKRLDNAPPARSFKDYEIRIDRDGLPEGVEIIDVV
jgi:CRISPR-associated protein Csd2